MLFSAETSGGFYGFGRRYQHPRTAALAMGGSTTDAAAALTTLDEQRLRRDLGEGVSWIHSFGPATARLTVPLQVMPQSTLRQFCHGRSPLPVVCRTCWRTTSLRCDLV